MHKKIALIINKICDESPYNHFKCEVIPNMDGEGNIINGGFWKCKIYFESRDDAHSAALVASLRNIGMIYGEGLSIQDNGKVVEVD